MKHKLNLATDFISAAGTRISAISIENKDGESIWIGDFDNGEVVRISAIPELFEKKDEILKECQELLKKNNPFDYKS